MSLIQNLFHTEAKKPKYLVIKDKPPLCSTKGILKKCPHCNEGTLEQYYYRFTLTRMLKNQFNVYTFLGCDKCNTYVNHGGICKELNVYDIGEKSTSVNEKEYKHLLNRYVADHVYSMHVVLNHRTRKTLHGTSRKNYHRC